MPCCNKKPYRNFGKCMIVNVDYQNQTIPIKDLKPGTKFGKFELRLNNTVLRGTKVYKVTLDGGEEVEEVTNLKLPIQPGMTINVEKMGLSYLLEEKAGRLKLKEKEAPPLFDAKYIQNENKFPLTNEKLGLLPKKLMNYCLEIVVKQKLKSPK